jgi:UDP-N-acetylmuramoyl-tripeptide--D-alanyl-D-alanine ligase
MMMMDLQTAATATQGKVVDASASAINFDSVSTDSRAIAPGQLFIALSGERFDGHEYLAGARQCGAVAAVVRADRVPGLQAGGLPLLVVDDTRLALGRLAAYWRRRFALPLIGVTGSNGKTTTKEMMRCILEAQARVGGFDPATAVLATEGNLNNDIGLPLTLLRLRPEHRAAIIEAGMNHPGEIAYLTDIARPTVGLVINALRAHLEGMGSLEGVAREKGSLFEHLAPAGVAVFNADSEFVSLWRQQIGAQSCLGFSLEGKGEVNGSATLEAAGTRLAISTSAGDCQVYLQMPGRHNAANAVAAAAATFAAGCSLAAIEKGLNVFSGVKGRLQKKAALNGATLFDDTYNANPDSMRAAIDVLVAQPGRRVLILGDMGETGADAEAFHREVGAYAKASGIDVLYTLGQMSALTAQAFGAGAVHGQDNDAAALAACIAPTLDAETRVLVKGSRFMKMERVVDLLTAAGASALQAAANNNKERPQCS